MTRRRVTTALTVAGFVGVLGLHGASPAQAVSYYGRYCSNGSYNATGNIDYNPNYGSYGREQVIALYYRLGPADSSSDWNNVDFVDYGTSPSRTASTGSGIRDNSFRLLSGTDYVRGDGTVRWHFEFDRWGTDPTCSASGWL